MVVGCNKKNIKQKKTVQLAVSNNTYVIHILFLIYNYYQFYKFHFKKAVLQFFVALRVLILR